MFCSSLPSHSGNIVSSLLCWGTFSILIMPLMETIRGQKVCKKWFHAWIHAGKESTTFWNMGSTSFYFFLVLPAQLCLSYLFTLFRLPRLAERRLDIYLSLTLLLYYKISSKDAFQSLWVCTHLIYLFVLGESLSYLKRIKSLHK